jgi:hypothetical protein
MLTSRDVIAIVAVSVLATGWTSACAAREDRSALLRLVLDVDGRFDPSNIVDDAPLFLPGSDLNGGNRPRSEVCGRGQIARLIAVFVDPSNPGRWVPAPRGERVTFSLHETTAIPGCANNAGTSTGPDYYLDVPAADGETVTVGFQSGRTAWVNLRITDYGGSTVVRAVTSGGIQASPLQLPIDNDGNGLPDRGWKAGDEWVRDPGKARE